MSVMVVEALLSLTLGIIFLAAAIPKLRHPKGFVLVVLEYRVLPPRLGWLYGHIAPPLECLLALLLLSGTAVRPAAIVLEVLLLSFIAAVGINMARGRQLDCHCFGKTTNRPIGWKLLLQDVALLGTSMVLVAVTREWVAPEPWSAFRLSGLVQAGSLIPLLGCAAVTTCSVALLGWATYGRQWYGSAQVSRK